jgi:hypothetical protein
METRIGTAYVAQIQTGAFQIQHQTSNPVSDRYRFTDAGMDPKDITADMVDLVLAYVALWFTGDLSNARLSQSFAALFQEARGYFEPITGLATGRLL